MSLAAGKEILSHCNKCKLTLAHTIVVMKSSTEPGKVQCNTCKTTHVYKDPTAKTVRKVSVSSSSGRRRTTSTTRPLADVWKEELGKSSQKVHKGYSPKGTFHVGEVIDHLTFGEGIVQKSFDGNKIEVLFEKDIKILIHNV